MWRANIREYIDGHQRRAQRLRKWVYLTKHVLASWNKDIYVRQNKVSRPDCPASSNKDEKQYCTFDTELENSEGGHLPSKL